MVLMMSEFFQTFCKIFWGFAESLLTIATLHGANWFDPIFIDLGVFLLLPLSVELMPPKWILIWVSLVVPLTIWTLEHMQTWFFLLCLELRRIPFLICLAIPLKFVMVFWLVRTITFDIFRSLYSVRECCMTPLPAVLTLGYTWIHVNTSNSSNVPTNIEASVD